MLSSQTLVAVGQQQISTELSDEVVILNLPNGVYYGLDKTGAFIWSMLAQPITVEQVIDGVLGRYAIDRVTCERDVYALLNSLLEQELVEIVVHPG
jgi:hypothetical protein